MNVKISVVAHKALGLSNESIFGVGRLGENFTYKNVLITWILENSLKFYFLWILSYLTQDSESLNIKADFHSVACVK